MRYLKYTEDDISWWDKDAYNFQGVGNPIGYLDSKNVGIKEGEKVFDWGSGLGVDAFIAWRRVGDEGTVLGWDIAKKQVEMWNKR